MKKYAIDKAAGFTLIEVMVVVVILSILAVMVVPNIMGRVDEAKITKVKQDIRAMENALELYKLDNGHYPSTDQGLDALINKPAGSPEARNWKAGGYIKRVPSDPWKEVYQYLQPGSHGEFDLYSLGPDPQDSNDDIGNWNLDN